MAVVPSRAPASASIDELVALVAADMERVNATILSRTGSEVTMIPEVADRLDFSRRKRLRPMLTLAMAGLAGYSGGGSIKLAAAVEFIHTATLLHDDVVDESELRRGRISANALFGNEASVLVGDFLFSRAFELMVEDGSLDVLRVLSRASAVIAEGEVLQLWPPPTPDHVHSLSAWFVRQDRRPVRGGLPHRRDCRRRPASEKRRGRTFGINLGIAFQIVDDVLDYAGERSSARTVGDDFREGKITLLVALPSIADRKRNALSGNGALDDSDQRDGDLGPRAETLMRLPPHAAQFNRPRTALRRDCASRSCGHLSHP